MAKKTTTNDDESQPDGQDKLTVKDALRDFKRAWEAKRHFLKEAKQDFEFALGKQWDPKDVKKLQDVGVMALTINKIASHLTLMKGIESQNRSDPSAFPEGIEDDLKAEIATRLMKNANKKSELAFKISEMFEDGNTCGESSLEPWIRYPYKPDPKTGIVDITGQLCWKKVDFNGIFADPACKEYDYSDAKYVCKLTTDLSANQLKELFPEKADYIDELGEGRINVDSIRLDLDGTGAERQRRDYNEDDSAPDPWLPAKRFDLLDYYFLNYVEKYYVADFKLNQVRQCLDEKEADRYVAQCALRDKKDAEKAGVKPPAKPTANKMVRIQPELWVAFVTGGDSEDFLDFGPAWCFPRWSNHPFFTYFCYRSTAPLRGNDRHYLVQGITRRVKDLNRELNKRRTQELRHLNSSANSGWIGEEDSFVDEDKWETFGAAPGVVLKYANGKSAPIKIQPTQLSTAHSQLALEHQQDMRDVIGVNPETLAIEAAQSSGRAIALRQKQGMVMVQPQFDNLARTRRAVWRFTLSVLPELYTVEKAMRVLGEQFLNENFQVPVTDPRTGQPAINPMTGQPMMQYSQQAAMQTINDVLTDAELGNFDVAVGENISTETIALANYMQLTDMMSKGIPIPPDVVIEESTLSESQKRKIISAIQAQAAAAASVGPKQTMPKQRSK